ncbi:HTH-type transcriptional regulator HexR [Pseudidiomarina piscicola]|uniref:HTH-type transcriptional regulator HexR n=1 Tax=Pseudidiomarina piscicola TaxID=2614830 RepID=A0A6S6WKB0_9GAMM|nr:transcriptional regulator HexR [Pseudidiomarina piscicola]CAB0150142.1 HTH-type transcriptional regulator HexR [Pseudidiomarina piscicola]VZT39581.1 HTH-type transcriptional regulator HexR [Pseudomonas aeruginosa]
MNLIEKLQNKMASLSKSERKVAQVVLADPQAVIHKSIARLAALAEVSEPTVNRFCRTLGAKGYPDFKLQLAQSLVEGTPFVSRHVEEGDTTLALSHKIFESSMAALNTAQKHLDLAALESVIDAVGSATKISFFGLGASASVAHDAQNKFLRFDTPVMFSDDILMQRMAAINAGAGDVIIFISHTGRTKALCEIATIARKTQATVIGITASPSPLADICTLVLSTQVPENTDIYMPMASRLAQLVLIDILITGYTLQRGPDFQHKLRLIKDSLRDSRFKKT